MYHLALQNGPFRTLKRPVSRAKTGYFATPFSMYLQPHDNQPFAKIHLATAVFE